MSTGEISLRSKEMIDRMKLPRIDVIRQYVNLYLLFWMAINGTAVLLCHAVGWVHWKLDQLCICTGKMMERYCGVIDIYTLIPPNRTDTDKEYRP
jgi:hypothetical protein